MLEGTTPEQVEEITPAATIEVTPESGAPAVETPESPETTATESLSPERVQELLQTEKRFGDQQATLTREQQTRAEAERDRDRYRTAILGREQQQAVDPLEAANAELYAAQQSYDEDAIRAAQAKRDNVLVARAVEQGTAKALQAVQLQNSLNAAKEEFGYTDADLTETFQSFAANPELIAVARAYKEGKLYDRMTTQQADAKAAADRAALHSSDMGGRAMGPLAGAQKHQHVSATTFVSWAPHRQEAYVKEHGVPDGVNVEEDEE